jgi:hypothetical protein
MLRRHAPSSWLADGNLKFDVEVPLILGHLLGNRDGAGGRSSDEGWGMSGGWDRTDRVQYYRRMAKECEEAAARTKKIETREQYLRIAKRWLELAEQSELGR